MHSRTTIPGEPADVLASTVSRHVTISRHPLAQVATVLTPAERLRVDAAGEGLYRSIHRDTVDDVIRVL